MDDATEPLLHKSEAGASNVRKLVPDVFKGLKRTADKFNARIASGIKETTEGLKQLHKFGLKKTTGVRPPSTSVPTEPPFHGSFGIPQAREVFNDPSVREFFNLRAWDNFVDGLHVLRMEGCNSQTFIFNCQLPSSLRRLEVKNCEKLQYLFDGGEIASEGGSFLERLFVSQCPLSSRLQSPTVLNHLEISRCANLVTLSSSGQLPDTLQHLKIFDCPKLESIAESFQSNMSLEFIQIWRCEKLKVIPGNLNSLSRLRDIYIWDCPSLVSFPEGGLPRTNLRLFSVNNCRKLRALPDHMHSLNCLQELELRQCRFMTSIKDGLPTSLTSLSIAGVGIYRPLLEWGFSKLTSLKNLEIRGCVYAESFPGMILPTSLTVLTIARFPKLKYLSSEGLRKLPALESMSISDCPALTSLPEPHLPPSLQQLYIYNCPLLETRCERDKGEDWLKISHIPRIQIDGIFVQDSK